MDWTSLPLAFGSWPELPQQVVNGLLLGSIYALIALGYTMVYGVLRLINFAHGEVFMIGAYTALFVSWTAGFGPEAMLRGAAPGPLVGVGPLTAVSLGLLALSLALVVFALVLAAARRLGGPLARWGFGFGLVGALGLVLAKLQPEAINLVLMIVAAMAVCAVLGVTIEFFAYRPMRDQPRISSLTTAIGVSLLLQFGGQLFLPVSPPPGISERTNPYRGAVQLSLSPKDPRLAQEVQRLEAQFAAAERAFQDRFAFERRELGVVSQFEMSSEGRLVRKAKHDAERRLNSARNAHAASGVTIRVPRGQLIMLLTALVLALLLRQLVLKTATGRAMRALSHDFDTAALMGVNVNRIVTITFVIGSALAGAGGMMYATFMGTPLTTFYGVLPGIKAFVAAVLGGIGNIPGALLGGVLMGVAETMVVWAGYSGYRDAIAFVILIVILLFRPGGLLGSAKVEKV
jgi:branched-chain amino acid transport system permease protein